MNESIQMDEELEEYVEVLRSYSYQYNNHTYSMARGEILMLLKRSNKDWWQVIRGGEKRAFFAPTQHIRVTTVLPDKMKKILRQQMNVDHSGGSEGIASGRLDGMELYPPPEHSPLNNTGASQVYRTQKEPGRVVGERKDVFPSRQQQFMSVKNDTSKGSLQRNSLGDLPHPGVGHQESSSSHTSRSSLNEGSVESLKNSHFHKQGMKAGSHDELRSRGYSHSTLDVSKDKAASNEELDGHHSERDLSFRSNQLSSRHRSSSFDFRIFHKEMSFSEMKQGSLDKSRKPRISKDPGNRRRSWAVEEIRSCENFRPSLTRGEAVDAAIVLDVPPKLPPKQRKLRQDAYDSTGEHTGKLEGPIDLKLEQVKMSKSGQPYWDKELYPGMQTEKRHSRHSSDPLLLSEKEKINSSTYQDNQGIKDPPVALPRKLLPSQAFTLEGQKEKVEVSLSLCDFGLRDANGNKVKKSSSHISLSSGVATMDGEMRKDGGSREPQEGQKQRAKVYDPPVNNPVNPEVVQKSDIASGKVPGLNLRSFKGSRKETKRKEEENGKASSWTPPRETSTPDPSHGGKKKKDDPIPPSPQCSPQRIVFDDWGEYIDEASRRPYYYNSRTREKRWKPPRKGIHTISIPEIPSCAKTEDSTSSKVSLPQCPPKCPTPDYPNSPRLPSKPFSYTTLPDAPPPALTRAATLTTASTTTPNASTTPFSHTLPGSIAPLGHTVSLQQNPNKQKVMPFSFATPPVAPPSSAKPTFPTTPTTPEFTDFIEDQNYALLDILYKMPLPRGWEKKYDAFTQRIYFFNKVTEQRWLATINDEGKVYYYEESGTKSQWQLPQIDDVGDSLDKSEPLIQPLSPQENFRLSTITENLQDLSKNTLHEGFLHRTFFMRDGKKVRKNWTHCYARYIVHPFSSGSTGILYFSKTKDEDKKPEIFEFFSPCYLEHAMDKKTSRQQVLGLHNGRDTEVLLQFEEKEIAQEWFKILKNHEGVEFREDILPEKEEKKGKKGMDKIKRETSVEQLSPDSRGITDKLRNFIKRRPMKETLEKKGIYKESVFGSTLAELCCQDKTTVPIFVLQCINHIEKSEENLRTDGLYRISGNAAQIQKIRFEVAQRNYTVLSKEKEIHNLSGALKLFFRELKEPLIPYENYQDFIQATGSEYRRMNQQAEKLMKAVNKLPQENYDTLMVLMQHLLRVSEYESVNRMSLSNLAIVFGPCLMWPKETQSHDLMTDVMLHNRVVEGLLTDFSKIFISSR